MTFLAFCKAFKNKKPAILYDVLKFLLGAYNEDFKSFSPGDHPSPRKKKVVLTEAVPEESLE